MDSKEEEELSVAMAKNGTTGGRLSVAVVDDDEDACLYFKGIFQSEKSFTFTAAFSSANEALAGLPCLQPDFVLVDISLPDIDGLECTKRLKRLMPNLTVVIVSRYRETSWFDRSMKAGAAAYLVKPIDPAQLIATLRFAVGNGEEPIRIPPEKSHKDFGFILSEREREVLIKMAEGLLYKEISEALGISYTAVHKCQYRLFKKLHVGNRSEAVRLWLENKGKN